MRAFRRALLALGLAGFAASAVRLRSGATVPTQRGGWRELTVSDLR